MSPICCSAGVHCRLLIGFVVIWLATNSLVVCDFPAGRKGDPPEDWLQKIQQGNMLYSPSEPSDLNMMPSVGNGYLATVVTGPVIYVSGVYNGLNTKDPSHRAAIPAANAFNVVGSQLTACAIDLEEATYYRRGIINNATFEQRWYAHRFYPNIFVHEIHLDNPNSAPLFFQISQQTSTTPDLLITPLTGTPEYTVYSADTKVAEEPSGKTIGIAVVSTRVQDSYAVSANSKLTFWFITAIRTTLETSDPVNQVIYDYNTATSQLVTLHDTHIEAWAELWQSRITVSGDLRLSQVVNASLYYILSSVRSDWPYSLSPGSLSSNGYNGHVFWDCETWMYPPILLLNPSIAASLIQYRLDRLLGAALKAQSYNEGYEGLMFPWESAFTGQEVCPAWAPTGQLEQHISGDIVFAVRQYWYLTKDINWISLVYPLVEGVANFWASRVSYNAAADQYEINGVIPPDEYAVNVNNSVYTNVVASISLDFAITVAELLNQSYPSNWSQISSKLKIPVNSTLNIHLEYDNYNGETIKQADVILLGYPLLYPMDPVLRKNDLIYYQAKTDSQGPAMTYAMETVAWLEVGDITQANSVWLKSWANAHDPFMVWTETPSGGTVNFITGAGGFLQGVLNGYGGIRLYNDRMDFNPQLPDGITNMSFQSINYLGNRFKVYFDNKITTVTLLNAPNQSSTPIELQTPSTTFPLQQNQAITFPVSKFSVKLAH